MEATYLPEKRIGIIIETKIIYFYKKNGPIHRLANEKMLSKYIKIIRRFCFCLF